MWSSSVSDRVKCREVKQDVEPTSAKEPASFTWPHCGPSRDGGQWPCLSQGKVQICSPTGWQEHLLTSDNVIPAQADLLYFSEESLHKMLERLGLN